MVRVSINPTVLKWARERAGYGLDAAVAGYGPEKIAAWESGEQKPTLAALKKLAEKYHRSPFFFVLPAPPNEPKTPDFRAPKKTSSLEARKNDPALRAFVFMVEARCEWAAEFRREQGETPPAADFVGCVKTDESPESAGQKIRRALGVKTEDLLGTRKHDGALRYWIDKIESIGVFVFQNDTAGGKGVPTELFRGLTVATDYYAPAVAINSQDSRRGKIFTLAHELAHLAIGRPGLSNSDPVRPSGGKRGERIEIENFCDNVAAEVLLPRADFLREWERAYAELGGDKKAVIGEIAERLHLSRSVAAVKAQKYGMIDDGLSKEIRREDYEGWKKWREDKGKTVFYGRAGLRENTLARQAGRLFSRTILSACRAGDANPTVARKLLGAKRFPQMDAIEEYWQKQGRAA